MCISIQALKRMLNYTQTASDVNLFVSKIKAFVEQKPLIIIILYEDDPNVFEQPKEHHICL